MESGKGGGGKQKLKTSPKENLKINEIKRKEKKKRVVDSKKKV